MPDRQDLADFVVDQARVSEHVTALILLPIQKGVILVALLEAAESKSA